MKILVCISHVPDTTSKINFTEGDTKFDTNGVQFVINPNDEFGLTRAMWFKEKQGASVDVVNVGGAETEPTLRKALAIGADAAIRVNTEATDGFAVVKQLAKVVKDGNYDDYSMIHTENFMLIDKKRQIRGFYDGTDPEAISQLLKDIKKLKKESNK